MYITVLHPPYKLPGRVSRHGSHLVVSRLIVVEVILHQTAGAHGVERVADSSFGSSSCVRRMSE